MTAWFSEALENQGRKAHYAAALIAALMLQQVVLADTNIEVIDVSEAVANQENGKVVCFDSKHLGAGGASVVAEFDQGKLAKLCGKNSTCDARKSDLLELFAFPVRERSTTTISGAVVEVYSVVIPGQDVCWLDANSVFVIGDEQQSDFADDTKVVPCDPHGGSGAARCE